VSDYHAFLVRKSQLGGSFGFDPLWVPDFLFDFQRALVEWAIREGRSAIFADCGLGKTPMQLVWAENVARKSGGAVLILTPLAVSAQTLLEAEKFGIEVRRPGDPGRARIVVTNYERLHHLSPADFIGVVCDESSILKNFDGVRRRATTEFLRRMPYRLLCTATAAPNDSHEFGTSSEALGRLGHVDMLSRFFTNKNSTISPNRIWDAAGWRLKGHAEDEFWRWVASWARAIRRPSDMGFDDGPFVLPPLEERDHFVAVAPSSLSPSPLPPRKRKGRSAPMPPPGRGIREERDEARRSLRERCEVAATLAGGCERPVAIWCHLNAEGDLLLEIIPDAVQVSGSDSEQKKEEAFLGFAGGDVRVIVIKPKIGAWGLNWQHCSDVIYFPSHSLEQYYQAVRRFWRFGQHRPVVVHRVTTEAGRYALDNLQRKSRQLDAAFARIVEHMRDALDTGPVLTATGNVEVPSWLSTRS